MKKLLFSAVLFSPFCLNADAACTPDVHSDLVYFKHIEGKGYGYKEGYSTVGAFLTPYSNFSQILPFLDLRGHAFNHTWKFAANAGAGIKWLSNSPLVVGAAAYYDYRQTHKHHYNQAGLSFELLFNRWEFRANGYLPFGEKAHRKQISENVSYAFEKFAGNSLYYTTTYDIHRKVEFAMKGADAEIGVHLMDPSEFYTVYLGAGPYYFHSPRHLHKHALGGQARLQARVTPYLTLQVSDSWDNLFHNNFQGEVSVNIPFGGRIQKKNASCNGMQVRMVQPMHRNEIIVADKTKEHVVKTIDPIAQSIYGGPLNFIFVNASAPSGGDGTFENPFNDLYAACVASHPNNVLYVSGDYTLTVDDFVILINNQSFLGSAIPQTVPTTVGNITIPAMTTSTPTITMNAAQNPVYVNGDNTVISGFIFNLSNEFACIINFPADGGPFTGGPDFFPVQNIMIANNVFNNTGDEGKGIWLESVSGTAWIQNNTFNGNDAGEIGIDFGEGSYNPGTYVVNVNILDNTVTGYTDTAILVEANTNTTYGGASVITALIANNISTANEAIDIQLFADSNSTINATLLNNVMNGEGMTSNRGLLIHGEEEGILNVTACNNTLSGYDDHAALLIDLIGNSTGNLIICDNTITDSLAGIATSPISGTQTSVSLTGLFTGNVIRSCSEAGIYWEPQSGPVTSRLTFENNILIDNGTYLGFSFTIQNQPTSTTTIFMNGNVNDNFGYGLLNFNTSDFSFNIEQGGANQGIITLVEETGTGPYNLVERHTAAP